MDQVLWTKFLNKNYNDVLAEVGQRLRDTDALFLMHTAGLSLIGLGDMVRGMDWTTASIALADAAVDWYTNGATACMEKEQYLHAILFLKNGLDAYPQDLKMTFMNGLCHVHIHEWGTAINLFNTALVIDPNFYHAKLSMGFCYHMLGLYEDAIEQYKSIQGGSSDDMEATYNNHACVLIEQGKPKEALQFLMDKCPGTERPGTLFNMSFLYLGLGEWLLGWQLYKYRETITVATDSTPFSGVPVPSMPKVNHPIAQTLHDVHGKHLFLFHEQGFGDTMMFVRYAQMLEHIAGRITIGVPKPLERLVRSMKMKKPFTVVSSEVDVVCDVALPMLDAPILFETTVDTIPESGPYFKVSSEARAEHWLPHIGSGFRVGICWAGATRVHNIRAHSIDRRRSIPFEMLDMLLCMGGVDFYSLQLGDHHKPHEFLTRILEDDFDLMDTAAIIGQLDLVITIDSAVAHLAAALGKPVWLLSRFDGCWRWFWNGETTTPWYSTMRIFRQPDHNAWPAVIEEVRKALLEKVTAPYEKRRR